MKTLQSLVRPNIWNLQPYSSARSEFQGTATVFIDANENLYCWSTAAKNWEVGKELTIKGTIKSLGTYQKQKITYLTRCSEVG